MPRSSPGQKRVCPFGALREVATGVAQVGNQDIQCDMSGGRAKEAKEWPVLGAQEAIRRGCGRGGGYASERS